jgi:hypothetical protein
MPAEAGVQFFGPWVAAFAGTSGVVDYAASTRRNRFHTAVATPEVSTLA